MPSGASGVGESVPYIDELLAEENGRYDPKETLK
jgi:hypothetical protein